mmetsp:Transcript_9748/g.30250  ORF Transcript_9748/g.30250 Transcript_9748/m.30250 type:complete len:251 (+) Transcript_9748:218-970(+)
MHIARTTKCADRGHKGHLNYVALTHACIQTLTFWVRESVRACEGACTTLHGNLVGHLDTMCTHGNSCTWCDKKSYRRLCARVLQANSPARSARCTGLEGSVAKRLPPKFSFLTTPSSAEVPSSTLGFLRMLLRGIFGFESREAKGLTASRPPTRAPSSSTFRRACCAGSSRNAVRSPPSAPPAASAGEGRPGLPGAKASACSEAKATTRRRSAAAPSSSAPATRTGKQREPGSSRDLCNRRSCAETCANC